jgi:hypothetical protein
MSIMWLVTVASLIGTIANIYRRRWCFWVWLGANIAWSIYDCWLAAWPQAALMGIYACLSVWGLISWRAKPC